MARLSVIPEIGNFGSDEAVDERRAVIAAIESRSGVAAEKAVRGYIEQAKRRMIPPRDAELSQESKWSLEAWCPVTAVGYG